MFLQEMDHEESPSFKEHDMNSLEEALKVENLSGGDSTIFTDMGNSSSVEEKNTAEECSSEKTRFSSHSLSFEDSTAWQHNGKHEHSKDTGKCRNSFQTQDHKISERKRRENHTRLFQTLSTIVPDLKKLDKLSIVNKTVEYVKYLQNRVEVLEQQNKKRKTESTMFFKNYKPNVDDFSGISEGLNGSKFVDVEVKVSANDLFIRVICDKENAIVTKLLRKLADHNLSIAYTNVLPFGNSTLNISIIAKVEGSMTMDDVVKFLNEELFKCCNFRQ